MKSRAYEEGRFVKSDTHMANIAKDCQRKTRRNIRCGLEKLDSGTGFARNNKKKKC